MAMRYLRYRDLVSKAQSGRWRSFVFRNGVDEEKEGKRKKRVEVGEGVTSDISVLTEAGFW